MRLSSGVGIFIRRYDVLFSAQAGVLPATQE
jgi:hypothetical protein